MTWEKFVDAKFRAFEEILYHHPRFPEDVYVSCQLLGLDFVEGLLLIEPFDKEVYEDKQVWVRHEHCTRRHPHLYVKKKTIK